MARHCVESQSIALFKLAGKPWLYSGVTREDWQRLSACWQADLEQRIRHLQQLRDDYTDCVGCGCMSIDRCPLINPQDVLGREGPGPRRLLRS